MRHGHIVVTLDSETKAEIQSVLDAGESVDAWVADAIEAKLADDRGDETEAEDEKGQGRDGEASIERDVAAGDRDDRWRGGDERDGDAGHDGGDERDGDDERDDATPEYEYVDDCGI